MNKEDKHVSKSSKKGVSPSDAGQAARTTANKVRNFSRARARAKAHQLKPLAVPRGTARAARRDAARSAWGELPVDLDHEWYIKETYTMLKNMGMSV